MGWRSLAAQGSSSSVALHTWPYAPVPSGASRNRRTEPKRIGDRAGCAIVCRKLAKAPRRLRNNEQYVWNAKVVKNRAAYCGALQRVLNVQVNVQVCVQMNVQVCVQMNVQMNVQMYVQMNVCI